ncbi:unnamed protein product [Vitrella brassicaformis CCMP3155]|uniref:Peptidase S74 domain-containing protein n=1 Tax=Vitrella brassicaformis (strain CCMP3155) TaxID=1169540 RepID=A0A0G4E8M6_VITBC|nr:unnamed protein product [Vitrella brassicaformis CCMP3155]|mmetsp:Transcript_12807/g.37193  ORF Transcript_12807/g.37193 Transcript_12807/m.37193 type:complete len:242 (-) Transcript_12807:448-1173(-)|eukprot:CEL92180.1 unnamed protein product [Vitrella brassicaformis CCMP3155]
MAGGGLVMLLGAVAVALPGVLGQRWVAGDFNNGRGNVVWGRGFAHGTCRDVSTGATTPNPLIYTALDNGYINAGRGWGVIGCNDETKIHMVAAHTVVRNRVRGLSDARYKTNIQSVNRTSLSHFYDAYAKFPLKKFNEAVAEDEAEGQPQYIGVVAQDLRELLPEAVVETQYESITAEGEVIKGEPTLYVDMDTILYSHIAVTKQLIQKVDKLNDTKEQLQETQRALKVLQDRMDAFEGAH